MAKIDKETTKYTADLIKIHLDDDELELYSSNLNTAIGAVETFKELNTKDTEVTSQTIGTENILRDDEVKTSFTQEEALSNAKFSKNGYFAVHKLFHDE